jgi:hypothetical protein
VYFEGGITLVNISATTRRRLAIYIKRYLKAKEE